MMTEREFSAACARINSSLDVKEYIDLLGYYPEKAVRSGGLWRLFCPLHKDTLFRTLVINPRRNTYHCEYSLCTIHQPGDLIDLLARVRGGTLEQAVVELHERFGAEKLRLSAVQDANLRELADSLRNPAPGT